MSYRTVQVDFQLSFFKFYQFEPYALSPVVLILKGLYFKLPGLGISNMNFLIADVI